MRKLLSLSVLPVLPVLAVILSATAVQAAPVELCKRLAIANTEAVSRIKYQPSSLDPTKTLVHFVDRKRLMFEIETFAQGAIPADHCTYRNWMSWDGIDCSLQSMELLRCYRD